MFTRFSSCSCWRKCHFRRRYSSSTAEAGQQKPHHAPIASEFGGVQINLSGSPFSRQRRRANSLDLREFKHGTLSEQLAIRTLQQKQQNKQSQAVIEGHPASSHPISSRTAPNTDLSHQQGGAYTRSRPPRQHQAVDSTKLPHQQDIAYARSRQPQQQQRRRNMDMHPNKRYPDQQGARKQRRSRPVQDEYEEEMELNEEEEEETAAIDDDINATKTSLRLRRPDPPLPPRRPQLPPSLTMLEQQVYIHTPTHKLLKQQGGDYVRHFSPQQWKIVRAQSSAPLGVVDYARLALHLNPTVHITQRKEAVDIVRKHVEKADAVTTAP